MKPIILLINFFFLLCILACEKDGTKNDDQIPTFKATKNGEKWVSTSNWAALSKTKHGFTISGTMENPKYFEGEVLFFTFNLSDISKSNTVNNFYSHWYYVIGGDAISDSYQIDSTANNLINLTTLDTVKKQISGTFTIKLLRDKSYSDIGEYIQFNEGRFNLLYKDVVQ